MDKLAIVSKIEIEVKCLFEGEGTGHDWYHIDRVRHNALKIGELENADLFLVELGALLHDIADHKFHGNDLSVGPARSKELILKNGGDENLANRVSKIVSEISYKGAGVETTISSLEAAVVQDADRLDAIGAIGIARAFAYGGSKNREIYNPTKNPHLHDTFLAYAEDDGATINHFYEKLLLLKDRMQTATGKKMSIKRHSFMEKFLETFYDEWNLGESR
ncbi:HD domain-containing protein [Cryomorpha ignava]|uniref:HD domain-containing protein n=1 Tax=Cryomorpha ignava TaxID=101383 RepID=A0A7K3WUA6_9FLAO|nr:HD domain-containing protein [Cryomorpha ignava]NEN25076.1 HD domain-containing protein [Cryomorpha ignava]